MAEPEDSDLQPLDVDGVGALTVGTAVWAVLGVVGLLRRGQLSEAGRGWWIWVCVAGAGLGLLALPYLLRRRRAYRTAPPD